MLSAVTIFIFFFLMESTQVQKFYPTAEELSFTCSEVKCPENNCKALFRSTSNLDMHLIKHHKIKQDGLTTKSKNALYFCPVFACPYHKDSKKHFGKLKNLKQHFLKVHAIKKFSCTKCEKKFSTLTFLTLHTKNCGKTFACTCGSCYSSSEALLTHIKRKGKGHESIIHGKDVKKLDGKVNKGNKSVVKKERLIYPKLSGDMAFPVHYVAAVALSELSVPQSLSKVVDKSIQTEGFDPDFIRDQYVRYDKKRKNSQQTQTTTAKNKKLKISIQTQTNNDYLKRKSKGQPKASCRKRKKSMETQTKFQNFRTNETKGYQNEEFSISIKSPFANKHGRKDDERLNFVAVKSKTEIVNGDEEKARKWLWEMVTSSSSIKSAELGIVEYNNVPSKDEPQSQSQQSSQTNQVFDLNRLCNIETQTDIDTFLTECNEDTNFTLCSTTETQTTDDFDCLLYSNMCTQTCEEVDQLFNFNFVHNETQTAWPDLNDCHEINS